MKFRTELEVRPAPLRLSIDRPVAAVGSCFADNITRRMRECLWKALNPLGLQFNPLSIANVLEIALFPENSPLSLENTLFESEGIWHSWLFDSSFSANSREETLRRCEKACCDLRETLLQGHLLTVTFGTAWCYALNGKGAERLTVSNCHKQPASRFSRFRTSIDEITGIWNRLLKRIDERYGATDVVLTVSPVRHLRDGLAENNRSKALLLLAAEEICLRHERCVYFPAYELLNDDLRDYRFYADDLVHPGSQAVEYIWEKFLDMFTDPEARREIEEGERLARRLAHRPIVEGTDAHLGFQRQTVDMLRLFRERHPRSLTD